MTDSFIDHKNRGASISGAIVFFLIGVFALFSILMVVLSAHTYTRTVSQSRVNADRRMLHHYIVNTVHAADCKNAVATDEINGIPRLVIWADEQNSAEMSIYHFEGRLLEFYRKDGEAFIPEYGEEILCLSSFVPSLSSNLLTVTAQDAGGSLYEISVHLNAGQGGERE